MFSFTSAASTPNWKEKKECPAASSGVEGFKGGDRTRIELPQVQEDFVRALHETGKPVVMVNCSGSAMAIPWEAEHLPAILQAWYPGEEGGRAVGEILFGDVNPSGHLPLTFYAATADLPDFTDYSMSNRTYRYFNGKPLFAFGHGLSYTKFTFQDGKLDSEKIPVNGTAKVSFTVENTGSRDGDEVAASLFPPRSFQRSATETRVVRFYPRASESRRIKHGHG